MSNEAYILTEVAIPGMQEMGIKDPTAKVVCAKCGKTKDKCTCKK